ncbi:MAG TPA: HutD family protein, partial [Steroidobacteraceae bacterium]|nr:HutD family protein [Steroidobacteraceae bacterium]
TREVARYPRASDLTTFDWRVSIAEVHACGPFSSFAGVDRRMAVLGGTLSLAIAGREPIRVGPEAPPLSFPGDAPVSAEPVGAAVTDLNVMTRRGRFESRLAKCLAPAALPLPPRAGTALILALTRLELRCGALRWDLSRLDAALIDDESGCQVLPQDPHGVFYLIELRACRP